MGVPERIAGPFRGDCAKQLHGFVKFRLGHSRSGSVFVPEQVFIEHSGEWAFYQTSFFGPPYLAFNVEPSLHCGLFNLDVGAPRTSAPTRLIVTVRSDELAKVYPDGARLYRCTLGAPEDIFDHRSGAARPLPDGDFALELFHVTNSAAATAIQKSRQLRSSAWNLQGTRKLKNVAYVYLTSLEEILDDQDLQRIGMSSNGFLAFQTTTAGPRERGIKIEVYRESTTGRTESLRVVVPSASLAPPHLLIHRNAEEAYYEVVGPEIYRIGLIPGSSLLYENEKATVLCDIAKSFSYIVVGEAAEFAGLAAPYDEEETKQIMHLEQLIENDPFEFWLDHANSDQMTARQFEPRELG